MRAKCLLIGILLVVIVGMLMSSSYAEVDPATIIGIWMLDEGKGDVAGDSSGNGRDGKIPEGVKWVNGRFGTALEFDGKSYVEIPHDDALNLETYTLLAWINSPKPSGVWSGVIVKRNPGHYGIWVRPNNGAVHHAHQNGGGNQIIESTTQVADGNWHHIAGTYDLKANKVYIDGVLEGEKPFSDKPGVNNNPLTIGGDLNNFNFTGVVDEAAVFNVALSEDDIRGIMQKGLSSIISEPPSAVATSGKITSTWASIKAQR